MNAPVAALPPAEHLRAMGIWRDPDNERTLFVIFNRAPSDDEMRAVHELLRGGLAGDDEPAGERPFAPIAAYGDAVGAKNYAAEAAIKCGEPAFKAFLEAEHGLERPLTDERCAQKLRSLLGITTRKTLNSDGTAALRWKKLRGEFEAWRRLR